MNNGIYIDIENAVRGLSEDQLSMFIAGLQFAKRSLEDIVVEFDDDGAATLMRLLTTSSERSSKLPTNRWSLGSNKEESFEVHR